MDAADQLAERLLEQRRIIVSGPLDSVRGMEVAGRLMLLDSRGDEPIDVVYSCAEGELQAAMALADTIELVGVEVRLTASGSIGGPAILPFAVATRRLVQEHSTFRLAEPSLTVEGRAIEIAESARQQADLVATLWRRLAAATGQADDAIAADFRGRRILTAGEAVAYGLADEVITRRPLRAV